MTERPEILRSRTMRAVKAKDTRPEWVVRRLLHAAGFRYRLHVNDLPGKPDLVFPSRRRVVFVHGCFWHGHDCSRGARMPKTNATYWSAKIGRNLDRDARQLTELHAAGWKVHVVWECETKEPGLLDRLKRFLGPPA